MMRPLRIRMNLAVLWRLLLIETRSWLRSATLVVILTCFYLVLSYQILVTRDMLSTLTVLGGVGSAAGGFEWWAGGNPLSTVSRFWLLNVSFLFLQMELILVCLRQDISRTAGLEFTGRVQPAELFLARVLASTVVPLSVLIFLLASNFALARVVTTVPVREILFWFAFHILPVFALTAAIASVVLLLRRVLFPPSVVAVSVPIWALLFFVVGATGGNTSPLSLVRSTITKGEVQSVPIADQLSTPVRDYFVIPPLQFSRFPDVEAIQRKFFMGKQGAYLAGFIAVVLALTVTLGRGYRIRTTRRWYLLPILLSIVACLGLASSAWTLHNRYWFRPSVLRGWDDPKRSSSLDKTVYLGADKWLDGISQLALNLTSLEARASQEGDCATNRVRVKETLTVSRLGQTEFVNLRKPLTPSLKGVVADPLPGSGVGLEPEYGVMGAVHGIPTEDVLKSVDWNSEILIISLSPLIEGLEFSIGDRRLSYERVGQAVFLTLPSNVGSPFRVTFEVTMPSLLISKDGEPFLSWGLCGHSLFLKPYAFTGYRTNQEFGLVWPFPIHNINVKSGNDMVLVADRYLMDITLPEAAFRYVNILTGHADASRFSASMEDGATSISWSSASAPGVYGGNFIDITPRNRIHSTVPANTIANFHRFDAAAKTIESFYDTTFHREIPTVAITPFDLDLRKIERAPELEFWHQYYGAVARLGGFTGDSLPIHLFLEYRFLVAYLNVPDRAAIDFIHSKYKGEQYTAAIRQFHLIRSAYKQDAEGTIQRIDDVVLRPDFGAYLQRLNGRDYEMPRDRIDYVVADYPRIPPESQARGSPN